MKPVHVFAKNLYQVQSKFNTFVLKKLKDSEETDTGENRTTILEEGIVVIKQISKLLVVSDNIWVADRVSLYFGSHS